MTAVQMEQNPTNFTSGNQAGDPETDPNTENPSSENPTDTEGRLVNCTVVTSTRITTLPNGTNITETTKTVRGPSGCQSLLNTSSTSERKKRAVEIKDFESEPLNNNDLQFYVGFQFDGMDTYSNFTSLPVYEDPEYFKFDDKHHVRNFDSKNALLHIKVRKA